VVWLAIGDPLSRRGRLPLLRTSRLGDQTPLDQDRTIERFIRYSRKVTAKLHSKHLDALGRLVVRVDLLELTLSVDSSSFTECRRGHLLIRGWLNSFQLPPVSSRFANW